MGTVIRSIFMDEYFYRDNVFSFEGAVSVETNADYVSPWRIDYSRLRLFPVLKDDKGKSCCGVRLCFSTDSKNVILRFGIHDHEIKMDVYINEAFHEKIILEPGRQQVELKTGEDGEKCYTIWLDHRHGVRFVSVSINDGAAIGKTPVTMKRWVHYGSSISQAGAADSPSMTWAAIAARKNSLHLTNLGFGGQCKIDPMMAFVISDLPSDFITLKLGINLYPGGLTHRTFLPGILGFVKIIREKKPDTPIVLISPVYCPNREDSNPVEGNVCLRDMRAYVSEAAQIFRDYGDKNIFYADGLKIFGPDELKYMPDQLHPNADGQPVFAHNFRKEIFGIKGLIK